MLDFFKKKVYRKGHLFLNMKGSKNGKNKNVGWERSSRFGCP